MTETQLSPTRPIARFLHLSDLHLGADFADVGGPNRVGFIPVAKTKAFRMQAHDPMILLILSMELQRLGEISRRSCAKAYCAAPSTVPSFDAVLVTGDISTDATSHERFTFAHGYLTAKVPVADKGLYAKQGLVGLEIEPLRLLCVPGNHDKMRETDPARFNSAFCLSPAQCNYVAVVRPHDRPIVLFGLDSNGYTEGNIAKGHVDYIKLGWLLDTIRKAESSGLTTPGGELSAEEFAVAPRCLLLHHHVLDVRSGALRDRHWARRALGHAASLLRTANPKPTFTVLDGAEDLLRAIRGRIDIVFHGHEHYATCFRDESGLVVISAGTASEWNDDGDRNSFYEVTIRDDQFVEIVEHSWDRNTATFRRVSPKSFPLERLRPRSKSPESLHRTD